MTDAAAARLYHGLEWSLVLCLLGGGDVRGVDAVRWRWVDWRQSLHALTAWYALLAIAAPWLIRSVTHTEDVLYAIVFPAVVASRFGAAASETTAAMVVLAALQEAATGSVLGSSGVLQMLGFFHDRHPYLAYLHRAVYELLSVLSGTSFSTIERLMVTHGIVGFTLAYDVWIALESLDAVWVQHFQMAVLFGLPLAFLPTIGALRENVRLVKMKPQHRPKNANRRKLWHAVQTYAAVAAVVLTAVRWYLVQRLGGADPFVFIFYRLRFDLVLYWGVLTAAGILCCIYIFSRPLEGIFRLPQSAMRLLKDEAMEDTFFDDEYTSARRARALDRRRKFFHLLVVVLFLPTLNVDAQLSSLALTGAMAAFMVEECLRATALPPFGVAIHKFLSGFTDSRDRRGHLVVSHLFLLAGVATPLWLTLALPRDDPRQRNGLASLAGVVTLGAGDAAASVFGKKFGRHKWPKSRKSIEGTIAFVVASTAAIQGALYFGWAETPDTVGAVPQARHLIQATVATALVEAVSSQNDNLIIPVYMWTALQA